MIDWMIQRLLDAPVRKHGLSLERRIDLCRSCVETVMPTVDDWIDAGARGKQCPNRVDVMAEELLSGPLIAVRLLRLLEQSFSELLLYGHTRLPQAEALPYERRIHGKSMLPIFPTLSLWDRLIFRGISADAIFMERAEPRKRHSDLYRQLQDTSVSKISLVLGAGNVSSVPFSDAIHKSLVCGHQVILKMNPVNAYLKPIFERAFAPLFQEGLLVAIEGDSQVGQALVDHPDVDDVHLTGSAHTHDRIVWGDDPREILARKEAGTPRLTKPVTSELGNVSPWIIVPGVYSTKELTSQAMHLAASITNNAGFNCLATRVIVTCQNWPQRREFLRLLQQSLQSIPKRPAYYPGALERYRRFTQTNIDPDDSGCLPYRLLESQSIDENPLVFQEESFTCVCVETPLASQTASQFLDEAVALCNLRLPGTLCASVSFPKLFVEQKRRIISQALGTLRYGCVSVNQWSALAYSLLTPPWGGAPGASLEDAQSGIGQVHNTYLLERVEKTVLYGPLVNFPKPVWFPGHRNALRVGRELIGLYHQPSNYRLMKLFQHALIGS
jgi:hypothetical protein